MTTWGGTFAVMAADPTHDFVAFAAAATDLGDEIEQMRPRPWQLRFWRAVEEGEAPKIVVHRGGRGLVPFPSGDRQGAGTVKQPTRRGDAGPVRLG